jgi:hypothetical protein
MTPRRSRTPLILAGLVAIVLISIVMHMNHWLFFATPNQSSTQQSNTVIVTIKPAQQPTLDPSPTIALSPTATSDPNGFSAYQKSGSHEQATCGKVKIITDGVDLRKDISGGASCQENVGAYGFSISEVTPPNECLILAGKDLDIKYPNGGEGGYGPEVSIEMDCNDKTYPQGYSLFTSMTKGEVYLGPPDKALSELETILKNNQIPEKNVSVGLPNKSQCSNYASYAFYCDSLPKQSY